MTFTDLIGVPFVNRGRDAKSGLDCYGLVKEVYRRYGYNLPEYDTDFNDMERISGLFTGNTNGYPWREISEPKVPCLIGIRFGAPDGVVNHTAVYIGGDRFIHTRARIGVNIDRISSPAWRRVIVGFYEYVGD
jgi:cell wall-associated NlpC family hydrolase